MNSNLKLLSAGLLVAALAGCGGGGGGEMEETPPPTPEEECLAGGGVVYEDGACKTAEDLKNEGAAEEGAKRDQEDADDQAAADAIAAQKAAETLRRVLNTAINGTDAGATPDADPATDLSYSLVVTATGPAGLKANDAYESRSVSVTGRAFNLEYSGELTEGKVTVTGVADVDGTSVSSTRAKAAVFATSGQKNHSVNTAVGTTNAVFRTSGTYHGVSGTFECDPRTEGTACASQVTTDGVLSLILGTWTFAPSSLTANVSDGSAVLFGWWTNDLGKDDEVARVFYGPEDAAANSTFNLGGTATYSGSAVGQYAIHRGVGAANDSGAFTADAMLEIEYGGLTAGDSTVSGMIDGFMGADGMARDWTVELESADMENGAWTAGTTVWTMGGTKGASGGNWRGATYGGRATATPSATSGAFNASHGNIGNMIGAFGADLDN